MWPLLVFLVWPLAEIALFVVIGGAVGVGPVLLWVVLTAALGIALLRHDLRQGMLILRMGRGTVPEAGLWRAASAVLLILPGFLTDAVGLALLLAPVRRLATRLAGGVGQRRGSRPDAVIIEGEWHEVSSPAPDAGQGRCRPSGWVLDADSRAGGSGAGDGH